MQTNPILNATFSGIAIVASGLIAFATDPASAAVSLPPATIEHGIWSLAPLVEKAGTVAILIWLVVWFQKRIEAKDLIIAQMNSDAIKALNDANTSRRELVDALRNVRGEKD